LAMACIASSIYTNRVIRLNSPYPKTSSASTRQS
jgi:hypothetical protein